MTRERDIESINWHLRTWGWSDRERTEQIRRLEIIGAWREADALRRIWRAEKIPGRANATGLIAVADLPVESRPRGVGTEDR